MKKFNWKEFMRTHPLFSSLNEMEIEEVLQEELSEEKELSQGALIVDEGEVKDTIFLIGSGSVQVVLTEKGGNETSLSVLRKGEIFGEMAVLDKRPRSATVKANEKCILLEVKGQEFLKILGDHPDLEFKILLKLSERLRVLNDHLLTIKVQDVDEKLKLFNSKLDAELKAVEASLKAAQAVFDQTKVRTDEVITSAERSRTRVNITFTSITTFVGAGIAFLGWLGFNNLQKIDELYQQTEKLLTQAKTDIEFIEKTKLTAAQVAQLNQSLRDRENKLADNVLRPSLEQALATGNQTLAIRLYKDIQELKAQDTAFINELLNMIQVSFDDSSRDFTGLLGTVLEHAENPEDVIRCYYLLLTNAILVKDVKPTTLLTHGETYNATFNSLQKYIEEHKEKRITIDTLSPLERLFEQQEKRKQEAFDRVKKVVLRP